MPTTHQVLARKWRPQRLKDLIGQEHICQILSHSLTSQRLHHAYLFTGTRGTGKTSTARIFAKALNCEQGISATPCGQCAVCRSIEAGRFVDLLEIDAASRTKVEDTRELLENILYAPTQGRYKIYLIDEVHMLSNHSFNALLKTLEEPPTHVIFLLATTDPQKLPITILSRCLQLQLKPLSPEVLAPHLAYILTQENIASDTEALMQIAQAAKGSVRDGLSLLDQAIAAGGGEVRTQAVSMMLGTQGQHLIMPLAHAILTQNIPESLRLTQELAALGTDFEAALDQLIFIFHQISIKQLAPDFSFQQLIGTEKDILTLATQCEATDIQLCYQIALLAKRDLSLAPTMQIGFEMAVLRMIAFRLESQASTTPHVENTPAKKAAPQKNSSETSHWHTLLPQLGLTALTKAFAEHLRFERQEKDHFYFSLAETHAALLQDRHRLRLEEALSTYFEKPINVSIQVGNAASHQVSFIEKRTEERQQKTQASLEAFSQDKNFHKILSSFDGKILTDTLELPHE